VPNKVWESILRIEFHLIIVLQQLIDGLRANQKLMIVLRRRGILLGFWRDTIRLNERFRRLTHAIAMTDVLRST
jgi:hypothetical protein